MSAYTIIKNPKIQEISLKLHDVKTDCVGYRENTELLGEYMAVDLSGRGILPEKKVTVKTPLGKQQATIIDTEKIGIVNILRAGTCMAMGMAKVFDKASIAFVSAWREYEKGKICAKSKYCRGVEDLKDKFVIITDPALATGSSLLASLSIIEKYIDPKRTVICTLNATKEGIKNITDKYPDIHIYTPILSDEMNEKYYIINGPGDCGDRCFNTK